MNSHPLLQKRLLIFTGKGGTGKTTISAAVGLLAAESGKRTLIVEVNAREDLPQFFGKRRMGYREREIYPNLYTISIDPFKAMEEYLQLRLRLKSVVNRIMDTKIYQYLSKATPGLKELATIGKVWHLCERARLPTGEPKYDIVILDAPSTGHSIPVLRLPQTAIQAIRVGPVVSEARKVQGFLSNREETSINVVTIPEEMPVSETMEFFKKAVEELDIGLGPIFVNMLFPKKKIFLTPGIERGDGGLLAVLNYFKNRREAQEEYLSLIRNLNKGHNIYEIPFFFNTILGLDELKKIAVILKEQQDGYRKTA